LEIVPQGYLLGKHFTQDTINTIHEVLDGL